MKLTLLLSLVLAACTAPSLPGIVAVSYVVEALSSTGHDCACDNSNRTMIYCKKNEKGHVIVAPINEATHLCCGSCMKMCEQKP